MLSVIITTYEDDARLRQTLAGFGRQRTGFRWEIVLVNDGGSDSTRVLAGQMAREHPMLVQYHYLEPPSPDFRLAAARNKGLQHAAGDHVAFCDCDTVPEELFIEKHARSCRPATVLVGLRHRVPADVLDQGIILDEDMLRSRVHRMDERVSGGAFTQAYSALPGGTPHTICWGCNFSAPKDPVMAIGGFDEEFVGWGGEDEDLALRLQRENLQFHPLDATVFHIDHPQRTTRSASSTFYAKRNGPVIRNNGPLGRLPPRYL